jgi:hypothetical protein
MKGKVSKTFSTIPNDIFFSSIKKFGNLVKLGISVSLRHPDCGIQTGFKEYRVS